MIEVRVAKFPNLNAGNVMDKQMEIKFSKITIFQRKIKENKCKILVKFLPTIVLI